MMLIEYAQTATTTLNDLPDELLLAIMSQLDPLEPFKMSHPSEVLYNACLVCRRWKECAQPLLWDAVVLRDYNDVTALGKAIKSNDLSRRIRILGACGGELVGSDIYDMLHQLPGLEDVRLWQFDNEGADDEDEQFWRKVSRMKYVNLQGMSIDTRAVIPPFSDLVSLTIFNTYLNLGDLSNLLVPENVPQLRYLCLGQLSEYSVNNDLYLPHLFPALLQQLHRDIVPHGAFLAGEPRLPQHVEKLIGTLRHIDLSTILLPRRLQHPLCQDQLGTLLELLAKRSIDVIWEDQEWEEEDGVWIREEFLRWLKGRERNTGK
ncbi:hypothetical protein JCM11251_007912 [Rhodosporidiobolus azoricus]